jgi:hypothetical protein
MNLNLENVALLSKEERNVASLHATEAFVYAAEQRVDPHANTSTASSQAISPCVKQ